MITIQHKWVVFVASVVVSYFNYGLASSFGAMYIGMLDTFNAGRAKTALVHTLLITFCWAFGIVSGVLISKFSITHVTFTAAVLTASGFFAAYFATSIYQLYGFISVVTGMGFATMYVSAAVCVGHTFTGRQRSMALAVQSVGTALSGFMWPSLLSASVETYSVRGTCLILSGIFLNNFPVAVIFSKCDPSPKKEINNSLGETNEGFANLESNYQKEMQDLEIIADVTIGNKGTNTKTYKNVQNLNGYARNVNFCSATTNSSDLNQKPSSGKSRKQTKDSLSFRTLCLSKLGILYITYVLGAVINMSTLSGFLALYQDINIYKGLTISQSDLSLKSYALLNVLSRFLPIIPARFPRVNPFFVPVFSSFCGGMGQLILLTNSSFSALLAAMALTAVADGGWISSIQMILFQILPERYQATGFGFMLTAMGIASAAKGPIFGSIRDNTSSYEDVLITTTTTLFVSSLIAAVCLLLSNGSKEQRPGPNTC